MKFNFLIVALIIIGYGCQYNSLEEPIDCTQSDLVFSTTITNAQCTDNGAISISASGGSPPYSFALNGGQIQSEPFFEQLLAGNYTIEVMDDLGCSIQSTVSIDNVNGLTASVSSTNATCGMVNGGIIINASNGTEPYQYILNSNPAQSESSYTVGAGTYDIVVIDANGCEFSIKQLVVTDASYSNDIMPILANSCSTTGCHDGSNSLPDFKIFSVVQANATNIKSRTQSGSMPIGGTLTQNQKDLIACWVDDGALNN